MKSLSVFCGSAAGNQPIYAEKARELGEVMAARGIRLVFGGGRVGLMGEIANAVLDNGGEVIGIIPHFLDHKEIAHENVTKLIRVSSMHERKAKMHELSDGVIAMPGGFGTMDEIFEIMTWSQLGLHQQPIALLNVNKYYDHLVAQAARMVVDGFVKQAHFDALIVHPEIGPLLKLMSEYNSPPAPPWMRSIDAV